MAAMSAPERPGPAPVRPGMDAAPSRKQLLLGGGHLAAVWALAFVQPLLDLLGKNPDFFVARGNSSGDILILALGFTFGPPVAILILEAIVARFSARAYNWLHLTLLGGIATFFAIRMVSKLFTGPTILILAVAIGLAVLFAWGVHRAKFLRNVLDILAVAPVVIVAVFIFTSQTTDVIFPGSADAHLAMDSGDDHPVVLVIFDELGTSDLMIRDGSIDAERFPNFARLSKEATWYRNQSTTAYFTPKAVPGILTGRLPGPDTLATAEAQPDNIFTLLGRDRPLHVMEPVTSLCPPSLCPKPPVRQLRRLKSLWSDLKYVEGRLVLPPGLADRLPDVGSNFQGFGNPGEGGDRPVVDQFMVKGRDGASEPEEYEEFIREIPDSSRGLTMMHLHLPHQPWKYTADGREYNSSPIEQLSDATGPWLVDSDGIATAQARMYTQTGFADRLVGQLRRSLKQKGLWDDAIVVVTADHGVSFQGGDVPQRMVDERAMGEVANPPLFIKYPGQRKGRVEDIHSMTLDILPTIARAVGIEDHYRFDGVPLQSGKVPERPITVTDIENRPISVDLPEMIAQRDAAIRRADRRLGAGPIYTLGPAPNLIGRPVPPVPAGTAAATLDAPAFWDDYRPDQSPIPINVTGTVGEDVGDGATLAIAVNGRVRGTGRTFEFKDATRFGALVDPASLKPGRNVIGIYQVDGAGLLPLGGNQG